MQPIHDESGTDVEDIVMIEFTIAPGGYFGWHRHGGPVWVVVKQGTLTLYDSDDETCTGTAQYYALAGGTQDRPTYLLGVYSYVTAFSPPPKYGLGSAMAVVLTLILLLVTGLYVRALIRQEELS